MDLVNKRLTLVFSASLVVGASLPASALEPVVSPSPSGPLAACPSSHGGACLGPLSAGTYRTTEFEIPFTVTVPDGWSNYEDLPGQVLLLPPGSTNEGVDAGTSDYIGIDQGVAVARPDCVGGPESGIRRSAEAMATAFAERDGLVVSPPVDARVGGLSGYMIDIVGDLASDAGCRVPDFPYPIVPLLTGTWPAELEHAQVGDLWTTRLYLLDHGTTNIVIEVTDVAASPGVTEDYLGVIQSIELETTAHEPASSLVMEDGTGDFHVISRDGEPVETDEPTEDVPAYADLTGVTVSVDGERLTVRFDTTEAVPEDPPFSDLPVEYHLVVEVDGHIHKVWDLMVQYDPVLEGWESDPTVNLPLEAALVDGSITASIGMEELLGSPSEMRFAALSKVFERDPVDRMNVTVSKDRVPDGEDEWQALGDSDAVATAG